MAIYRRKYVKRYSAGRIKAVNRSIGKKLVRRATAKMQASKKARRSKFSSRRKISRSNVPLVMYNKILRQKVRTILTYADTKSLDPGVGSTVHWFRLNSLFDPDSTGGGHKPAYVNKWDVLYDQYRVTACSFTIVWYPRRQQQYNVATTTSGIFPYADATHYDQDQFPAILGWEVNNTETRRYLETADKNVVREIGPQRPKNFGYSMTRYGKNTYVQKGFIKLSNIYNDTDRTMTATLFGNNPAAVAALGVVAMSKDGLKTCQWSFDIKMKFYVVLSQSTAEQEN